ncbi:hypothetical protein [Streptomyces eurythermus]|uniref:hypothetical protein n=1 Tax=Streptomyces eurythermus TaxID=42237 RepID=UPI003F4D70A7
MADGRRTIAVLGEMQELGEDGGEEHRQVGRLSATAGIHMLIAVGGDDAQTMADAAQQDDPQLKVVAARDRLSRPRPQPGPRDAPAPGHRPGQGLPQGRAGARGGAPGRARHHERRPLIEAGGAARGRRQQERLTPPPEAGQRDPAVRPLVGPRSLPL